MFCNQLHLRALNEFITSTELFLDWKNYTNTIRNIRRRLFIEALEMAHVDPHIVRRKTIPNANDAGNVSRYDLLATTRHMTRTTKRPTQRSLQRLPMQNYAK